MTRDSISFDMANISLIANFAFSCHFGLMAKLYVNAVNDLLTFILYIVLFLYLYLLKCFIFTFICFWINDDVWG